MIPEAELDALYAAPLGGFLDARKEIAARLRKAGDKTAATEVQAVAKPTPAAWAVNQLHRAEPNALAALLDIGARLRAAMRAGLTQGAEANKKIVAIDKQQREAVAALVVRARELLEAGGASASAAVVERIQTTLKTLSTTGAWGGAAPGRLGKELGTPSVEEIAALLLEDGGAETGAGTEREREREREKGEAKEREREKAKEREKEKEKEKAARERERREALARERAEAEAALRAAEAAVAAAAAEEKSAVRDLSAAQETKRGADARVAELEASLAAAKGDARNASERVVFAEKRAAATQAAVKRAEADKAVALKRVAGVPKI